MITDLGQISVIFALIACMYAIFASWLGATRNDARLVQSGRAAAAMTFPLVLVGAIGLWAALLGHDFGVKYVVGVSSYSTPLIFNITSLWGSQNGSILFWNLLMSGFVCAAMVKEWKDDKPLLPWVTLVMSVILGFFIFVNLIAANPFARLDFPPSDGNGLNPLLRHPGMIIHPPMLYAGYTGFIIPFAYCVASLITRRSDALWVRASRRSALIGWAFLTAGLVLGGRWAHDVLGWGGYWGWDPSENMPFVTWLVGTAFLHSAMIQEKRGMFKNWSVMLMMITFGSMFFGTSFIRSGLLTSVHAFAQSNLAPLFFGFMLFMLIVTAALWITRLDALKSDNKLDAGFSREGIFLLQNVLFVSAAFTTFVGTIFPVLSEAISGVKITVGPPFYNQAVGPQLLLLVFLMGVAPLLAWRKASGQSVLRQSIVGIVAAILVAVLLMAFGGVREPVALLGFALWGYTLAQQLTEYVRGVRARVKNLGEGYLAALGRLFQKNQRKYGGYLIHIGVILLAIGAIGKGFFGTDVIRSAGLNESFNYSGYTFTYRGIQEVPCDFDDCQTVQGKVLVQRADGSVMGGLYPHKDVFPKTGQSSTIADTTGTFNEEVYVILAGWENNGETASFQIYINPLINWVWVGGIVMIIGFFAAFWPHEETAPKPARASSPAPAGANA